MSLPIIVTLTAIIGALISLKFKGWLHRIIAFGLAIVFGLTLTAETTILHLSLVALLLLAITTLVYGLTDKDIGKTKKAGISLFGFLLALSILFKWLHLPGVIKIKMVLLIPLLIYLAAIIFEKKQISKDISFMISWFVFAVIDFYVYCL